MPAYASHKGQIMAAIEDIVRDLQPEGLVDSQVAIREDWLGPTGDPYYGASIIDMGEQYDDGTCGTSDVGYIVGIVLAKMRSYDSILSDDKVMQWYELIRRRFADQRVLVTPETDGTSPKEHVCIVMPGKTLTNPNKWPNYIIRQLVVVSWVREVPISY